jgi:hypothetical protein
MSFGELATTEPRSFHLFEESGYGTITIHLNGARGSG